MSITLRFGAVAFALTASTSAFAGSDTQYWQVIQLTAKVSSKVVVSDMLVIRSGDAKGLYQIANHLSVGYVLNKHVTASIGYTTDEQMQKGHHSLTENRLRQQLSFDGYKWGKVTLSGRLRLEERWRSGIASTGWRLRPYVKASIPLRGKLAINLSHENFIQLNTNTFQKAGGLERMRNAVMLSTPIAKHSAIEVGYLEQHGFVRGGPDSDDHVAILQLNASF